jgi:hypothetical protein
MESLKKLLANSTVAQQIYKSNKKLFTHLGADGNTGSSYLFLYLLV